MKIRELLSFLEMKAPGALQESYDNSGLLVGNPDAEIQGLLVSLDCTEEVIADAISKNCNVIVSHHPIIFGGIKRFTGKNYIERTVMKAIKHDIHLISYHTNLDNVAHGVNAKFAEKLGLERLKILSPKRDQLVKLQYYVPSSHAESVRQSLWDIGCGHIGAYDHCSFNSTGTGTFRASEGAEPFIGEIGKDHSEQELKTELVLPSYKLREAISTLKKHHPYEEVAYDSWPLSNEWSEVGSGMIGELSAPMEIKQFLTFVKDVMGCGVIKHTRFLKSDVQKIAICGGSGSFLLEKAIAANADVFITSDYKYHQFFDADGRIVIADIGHFETEHYTIDLLIDWFAEKFLTFAVHKTGVVTNPINYL